MEERLKDSANVLLIYGLMVAKFCNILSLDSWGVGSVDKQEISHFGGLTISQPFSLSRVLLYFYLKLKSTCPEAEGSRKFLQWNFNKQTCYMQHMVN